MFESIERCLPAWAKIRRKASIAATSLPRVADNVIFSPTCHAKPIKKIRTYWVRNPINKKIPAIIPVSFVSDHSETLVELDIDYRNKAKELGATDYIRVESLNFNQFFIESLTKICLATDFSSAKKCFSFNSAIDLENIKNNCSARICPSHFTKCLILI